MPEIKVSRFEAQEALQRSMVRVDQFGHDDGSVGGTITKALLDSGVDLLPDDLLAALEYKAKSATAYQTSLILQRAIAKGRMHPLDELLAPMYGVALAEGIALGLVLAEEVGRSRPPASGDQR